MALAPILRSADASATKMSGDTHLLVLHFALVKRWGPMKVRVHMQLPSLSKVLSLRSRVYPWCASSLASEQSEGKWDVLPLQPTSVGRTRLVVNYACKVQSQGKLYGTDVQIVRHIWV